MGVLGGLAVRVRALLHRADADRDLDDEIAFHLERETEKNLGLGMSPAEARRRALVAFGGVQQTREAHREVRGFRPLEEIVGDARFAVRALRRSPALAGAAILTLALGVGANTAIFSAVNAVVLRPLPFPDPERLVLLWEENPERGWYQNVVAPANYLDWREQVPAFEGVAGYTDVLGELTLAGDDAPPRIAEVAFVTGDFFEVLGVAARLGRTLRAEETWEGGEPVVVLSDRLWRERFASDPRVVGRTVSLGGRTVRVVGVMGPRFAFPLEGVEAWVPVAWERDARGEVWFRRAHWLRAVARLRAGVSPEQANAQLQAVARRLQRTHPETNATMGAGMTPLHEFLVGDTRRPLFVLLGAVALLLLIACANVGNLLLVQASGRASELSLRLALGAGRMRLVRQSLTESLVLSAVGGGAGLALGWAGTRALASMQPAGMLRVRDFAMDWSVLAFVLAITTASGLLFGVAPALWSVRRVPADALRERGRTGSVGRRMRRWGDALVVGEVALALLLTVGAGLLVRSFRELRRVDPGFEPAGVATLSLNLPRTRYDSAAKVVAFYRELVLRARAVPGVTEAALVRQLPLTRAAWSSDFSVAGRGPGEHGIEVVHREVSPEYFRTMRVPLLRGRAFGDADGPDAPRVVIVNDALARTYFRGEDPIGRRIAFDRVPDSSSVWRTIVGVVGDERQATPAEPARAEIFAPVAQAAVGRMTLVARTPSGDPAALRRRYGAPSRSSTHSSRCPRSRRWRRSRRAPSRFSASS